MYALSSNAARKQNARLTEPLLLVSRPIRPLVTVFLYCLLRLSLLRSLVDPLCPHISTYAYCALLSVRLRALVPFVHHFILLTTLPRVWVA